MAKEDKNKKVLIVEDNLFLASLLRGRLERRGFAVAHAGNGIEASTFLKDPHAGVDLIILDLLLPEKSGIEVLREVKEDPQLSQIPVIVVSNLSKEEDIKLCEKFGLCEYYVKSRVSLDKVIERVEEVLK